jgi:hypothetical protein
MDRIGRALANLRQQKLPLIVAIRNAHLDEDQTKEIMGNYWTPSEILRETSDRIRSSSIDDPDPPSVPEEEALQMLSKECGMDIKEITKSLKILYESVGDKMTELRSCEKDLRDCEDKIKKYDETIKNFREGLRKLNMDLTIPSNESLFIDHINNSFYENIKEKDLPTIFKKYQILRAQMVHLQTMAMIIANHTKLPRISTDNNPGNTRFNLEDDDDGPKFGGGDFPNCRICMMNEADQVFIPCGHIACKQCMSNLPGNNRCFFCRATGTRIIQMFSS